MSELLTRFEKGEAYMNDESIPYMERIEYLDAFMEILNALARLHNESKAINR